MLNNAKVCLYSETAKKMHYFFAIGASFSLFGGLRVSELRTMPA